VKITREDIDRQRKIIEWLDQFESFAGGMPILAIDCQTREEMRQIKAEYMKRRGRRKT
jgi:predicted nucleic acid-binding protein